MKVNYTGWVILGFLFLATGLSFLDRQILSMTIIKIQNEFNISDVEYGMVNTAFLISYAVMFTLGGRVMEIFGGKIGLALSVGLWSVASCLHGVMTGFVHLVIFRFLLGLGEGGCFPGAAKIVYEWFSEQKRAMVNGIAIAGSAIGAVVAPVLVVWLSIRFGWRWSFVVPGLIGICWVIGWLLIPWKKQTDQNKANSYSTRIKPVPFFSLLRKRPVLVFIVIRFILDPVVYFFMFWIPKYLNIQRGISFEEIGKMFWIPFFGLGLANIAGGWCSDKLLRKGFSINSARKTVMGAAALATMAAPLIAWVSTTESAIALMTLVMVAHGFWITNYITSISDIYGSSGTATVVGLSGSAGAISGLLVNPVIGLIVQNYSYSPIWFAIGFMYPLAFVILLVFIPKIQNSSFSAVQRIPELN